MIELFQAGGISMFFVAALGLATFVVAVLFARKPDERKVGILRSVSAATAFIIVAGVASNVATVMAQVPRHPQWAHSPDVHLIVMEGIGESLAPAILGFTMLALAWLVTAVGVRRLAASEA